MNSYKVDDAEIFVLDTKFFHTIYRDDCIMNTPHLEKIRTAYTELNGSEDLSELKLIVEFQGKIEISQDVGERYINNKIRNKTGEALVSTNPRTKEFLTGASMIMNGDHPIRVFDSVPEAKEWLDYL